MPGASWKIPEPRCGAAFRLQCYYELPSAVAALSGASADGFTVSGSWRQQFDWAVLEWNRDNTIEHPALRNLPDGDLSGLTLSYREATLVFYELVRQGNGYASATITFAGTPPFGGSTQIEIAGATISKPNYITDTAATIAKAFELIITAGTSAVWAEASGAVLTIYARAMGIAGNAITIAADTFSMTFTAAASDETLTGGVDGVWHTDLAASPRVNRAARDWHKSYFEAMAGYGIDVTAAFSMELGHGDDSLDAGIAARYPSGDPVWLNTPSLHTNFSPQSVAWWREVYRDMADVMAAAGVPVYLQFGEVQWWYFAAVSGMPFYDSYTVSEFASRHGHAMAVIASQHADPAVYPEEAVFLPALIGEFTDAVMAYVRAWHPSAVFEVLYPPDTNDSAFGSVMNFPSGHWTSLTLACLKTENFTHTGNRDLDKARASIDQPGDRGFPREQAAHLVGCGDFAAPWDRERRMSLAAGVESVVLFALDQFCLVGWRLPLAGVAGGVGYRRVDVGKMSVLRRRPRCLCV